MFYKGFNGNLHGYGEFQFEISKEYSTFKLDTWEWFHYAEYVSSTLIYFEADIRVCEVTPLGKQKYFPSKTDGYGNGHYSTNKIRIDRELTRYEIFDRLLAEKCPLFLILQKDPPFEILKQYKANIRGSAYCSEILRKQYLTNEQKSFLLPKSWHKHLDRLIRSGNMESIIRKNTKLYEV